MKFIPAVFLALSLGVPAMPLAFAADSAKPATAPASMSEGEVKKVDKANGKMTIKHGPLTNLDMPAMTMVFRVRDQAMLDQVKPGDRISFVAGKVDGKLTVMQVQARQ